MIIRWFNVLAFGLAIIGLILGIKFSEHSEAFLTVLKTPGPHPYTPAQIILGLESILLIGLSIIAMLKIFFYRRRIP